MFPVLYCFHNITSWCDKKGWIEAWFLTSSSPVSFSLRTKLSCSRSGPAISLRRRGCSYGGSFWNKSAGEIKGEGSTEEYIDRVRWSNPSVVSNCLSKLSLEIQASFPYPGRHGASACTGQTCRDCPTSYTSSTMPGWPLWLWSQS